MNFQNWLHMAIGELMQSPSPRRDAEILLEHVTGQTRTRILGFGETLLTDAQTQQLAIFLRRRKNGEPIAYLTGEREFWSLPIYVSPSTLIPRPDTECLVEQALIRLPLGVCRVLDLGTGTGAIALALVSERPNYQVTAVDIIPEALQITKRNISRLAMKQNVQIIQSDWFNAISGQIFNVIISNPPYIDKKDPHLSKGDVRFEPRTALVADEGGLSDIRHIVATSPKHLHAIGWLFIEHGWNQGKAVRTLFIKAGFRNVETCSDYAGNDRVTLGQWG